MKKKSSIKLTKHALRKKAELLYSQKPPQPDLDLDQKKLLHELQVHQIELELQNKELNLARHEAEILLENFTNLYNFAPIAYFSLAEDSLILNANYTAIGLFNQPIDKLQAQRFGIYVTDESKPVFNAFLDRAFKDKKLEHCEILVNISKKYYWLSLSGMMEHVQECLLVTAVDITERKLHDEKLKLAYTVYESINEPIMILDHNHIIIAINPAFQKLTGFADENTLGKPMWFLSGGKQKEKTYQIMVESLVQSGCWEGDILFHCADGEEKFERLKINTVYNSRGEVLWYVVIFFDITLQRQTENVMKYQASSDLLTGLSNRRSFQLSLRKIIKEAKSAHLRFAVLFLDVDKFKFVNDVFGHEVGDFLLKEIASRLKNGIRKEDLVARWGGDEFIFLIKNVHSLMCIERICNLILQSIKVPFHIDEHFLNITASIGIALFPDDGDLAMELIKKADQAMYVAKRKGRDCHCYFTKNIRDYFLEKDLVVNELVHVIHKKQLVLYYAPISCPKTRKVLRANAFLYWQHPLLGLVEADRFMLVATELGLLDKINQWIIEEVSCQLHQWRSIIDENFEIFVKVFSSQIEEPHINLNYIDKTCVTSNGIVLELSERLFVKNSTHLKASLQTLQDKGFKFLINHFQMKDYLFQYLTQFKFDYIKIDFSFIKDNKNDILCEVLLQLMKKLQIMVIVEDKTGSNVEELNVYDLIQEPPLPLNEFLKLLVSPKK